MNAVIVTPEGSRPIPITPPDSFGDLEIHVNPKRTIVLGRNKDPQPDETPYVAYWTLGPEADKHHEWDKVFGGKTMLERLHAFVFEGADMEPELPTEVANYDGISVVRVDLHKQLPHHAVIVPERYVP